MWPPTGVPQTGFVGLMKDPQSEDKTNASQESQAREKGAHAKQPTSKPNTERFNKKAEVVAMMKRAKDATLAEIMAARSGRRTPGAAVKYPRQRARREDRIIQENADDERMYKIAR